MASMGEGLSIQDTDFIITYQNSALKTFRGDHLGEHCYTAYENKDHICEGCPTAMVYSDGGIHRAERCVTIGEEDNVSRDYRITFKGYRREYRGRR